MKFLGNILWLIFGGIIIAIIYYIVGLLMCISLIGIPFGVQLFRAQRAWLPVGDDEPHLDPLRLVGDCHSAFCVWPSLLRYYRGDSMGLATFQDGYSHRVPVW